ncbi:hypothetical protein HDV05_001496 [Chytridiales sp. JEL 0842]|nr:hypothetical protein HDV05_001496 [Chytridiales sp. JEL 0842]
MKPPTPISTILLTDPLLTSPISIPHPTLPHLNISPLNPTDTHSLVSMIASDPSIHRNTISLPHPYTPSSAEWFINHCTTLQSESASLYQTWKESEPEVSCGLRKGWMRVLELAIRDSAKLIGTVRLMRDTQDANLKGFGGSVGYMLDGSYRGRGVMPAVVERVTEIGFSDAFQLVRIEAHTFGYNTASGRVLEKAGWEFEGVRRCMYLKDGKFEDGKVYAITRDIWLQSRQ